MFAIGEWAGLTRIMRRSAKNIRVGLVDTFFPQEHRDDVAANPFEALALIIMSVAGEKIAVGTERDPILVKAAFEAGMRLVIALGVTDSNSAQSMKIMIDKLQDFFMTFARIAKQFADLECRKTLVQILKTRDGQQMVVAIGGSAGTCECPDESESVVNDVEGFGFVSEMMLSVRSGLIFFSLTALGLILPGWLDPE
jgi:hypothetical protein